jgi:hypothetical protein
MSNIMDMITQQNKAKLEEKKQEQRADSNEQAETVKMSKKDTPVVSVMQPVRTNSDQVLFRSVRPNFAFFYQNGERVQFKSGFLCTEDTEVIDYIKDNYLGTFISIVEQGEIQHIVPAVLPNGEE